MCLLHRTRHSFVPDSQAELFCFQVSIKANYSLASTLHELRKLRERSLSTPRKRSPWRTTASPGCLRLLSRSHVGRLTDPPACGGVLTFNLPAQVSSL